MNVAIAYPTLPTSKLGDNNDSHLKLFANAAAVAGPPIAAEEPTSSRCGDTTFFQ